MPDKRLRDLLLLLPLMLGPIGNELLIPTTSVAQSSIIQQKQRAEKKYFTDAQIIEGFLKTSFGAEFQLAGRVDRIRKYVKPVRVFAENNSRPERTKQLAEIVTDIGHHIQHIDIAMIDDRGAANVIVTMVRERNFGKTLATMYGDDRAKEIKRSLDPQCLSGFTKNDRFEIEHSEVILTIDAGDFIFRDCAYEELLQALGPINDTSSVPWTMFNDDVQMGFFDVFDQLLLNVLYDPRIKPGMTIDEVKSLLPEVLVSARSWVAQTNGLAH
jgi:Protein of unknown function (DUF2927)